MRTFEEIRTDILHARDHRNVASLQALADEMRELGTLQAEALAFNALGLAAEFTGDVTAAVEQYQRALAVHEENGDRAGAAGVITNIGNIQLKTGDFAHALESYHRARAIDEELGDRVRVALVTGNIGIVIYHAGDYATAMEHFRRALVELEEFGKQDSVARNTQRIGNVYTRTGDYVSALEYYRRAQAMFEELGDQGGVASVTDNIGSLYESTGDYTSALELYRRTLAMREQLADRIGIVGVLGNLILVLTKLGQYDQAAELLQRQTTLQLDDPAARTQHHTNRAALAEHHGDLDAAHQHLLEALAITMDAGLPAFEAECRLLLRDLAQKRNDFAGYIEHNNEYARITEEIRGKEATQRLTMMEAERRMEGERREREKERSLLYGALPKSVADRMIRGEDVSGDHFDHAAVMFLDIVGFTSHTSSMPPSDVVKMLENVFRTIDGICNAHSVIKVKTIGDSYMCFRGDADAATNASAVAAVALDVLQHAFTWPNGEPLQFRVGMHIGPATAGVIGTERLQYDVWGDTVNVASRMESSGEAGRVHVTEAFASELKRNTEYTLQNSIAESRDQESHDVPLVTGHSSLVTIERGSFDIKGKGPMQTHWLERAS